MTEQHRTAAELAVVKVLAEQLKAARADADEQVAKWRPKDRAAAILPGDVEIGSVTLTSGRTRSRIADEAAFEAWVKKAHPEMFETVTITRPNPAFVDRLLAAARKLGTPVDAETGEEVPGIAVEQGDPFPMIRLNPDAPRLVGEAWQRGELAELVGRLLRPALEGGPQ